MIKICLIPTDIDHDLLTALADFLSAPEIRRATRLRQAQDQKNYIVAHAALRILLARHLQLSPHELDFRPGRWGKPRLTEPAHSGLHFNLSHSGSAALVAIAGQAVGIDIEQARTLDHQNLARHNFAPDEAKRITDSHIFFDIWTAKEAVVKACGQGLASKLQQFVVPDLSENLQPIRLVEPNPDLDKLCVARLPVGDGYHAALSMADPGLPLSVDRLYPAELIQGDARQAD